MTTTVQGIFVPSLYDSWDADWVRSTLAVVGRRQPLRWNGTPRGRRLLPGRFSAVCPATTLPRTRETVTSRAALVFIESPVFAGWLLGVVGDSRAGEHGRDAGAVERVGGRVVVEVVR